MTTTTRPTDAQLKAAVVAELDWVPGVDASHIGVTAEGGAITLYGQVESYPEKMLAAKATQRVRGVLAIALEITVSGSRWNQMSDSDVARIAGEALERAVDVPDSVTASVHDHVVTLSGSARPVERRAAIRAVAHLDGVRNVEDSMRAEPTRAVTAARIKEAIAAALARNARIDGERLIVTVDDAGVVTLAGTVRSLDERQQAEHSSWAALGVTAVRDDLTVDA
jgi:osmotically-inducible protein OsmY